MNSQQNDQEISQQHQITGKVVIYARIAPGEKLHQNNETQTDKLRTLARQLGWSEEQIIVIDQNNTRPVATTFEEREGLQSLVLAIWEGTVHGYNN